LCLELASGGMASVFLARSESDNGLGRMVAVKLIHPHLSSDREFVEMFMDEAELASKIRHPNVCAVLDYDLRQDQPYIAMEYLVGESLLSLQKRIERAEKLDPVRLAACVARMLADACEGLHAAHELNDPEGEPQHVVHRDVSPENVFVTYDGVAKVMDFGVAAAAHKRHRTQTGMVKGKFASIAPECLKGSKPDRRADLWGIGVIAWELLTGKRLFRRDTDVDTLLAVSDAPISPPSELRPGLPSALDEIVLRALARDPEQRYATARELGRDLSRFCARDGEAVTSADVAAWLRELFPGGRERRQEILDLAAQVGTEVAESTPPRPRVDSRPPTPSTLRPPPRDGESTKTSVWLDLRDALVLPPLPGSSRTERKSATRWPGWPAVVRGTLLVFVIASAGAISALLMQALLYGAPSARAPAPAAAPPAQPHEIILRVRVDAPSTSQK
jgi:eukaryotic-like serine/threonine-protein kinase